MKSFLPIVLNFVLVFVVSFAFVQTSKAEKFKGRISVDGSSTVFPLSEAVAEEARSNPALSKVRVGVNLSGTGGGFKKFCKGELDVTGASRPIKPSEIEMCAKEGIEFIELPVAYDGIAVIVNPANQCVNELTTAELKRIWEPAAEGKITNWNQISPKCPSEALKLYGPGLDSGTFDYFSDVIIGKSGSSRPDFTKSEDDNVLATGVAGDKGALGYFGFAFYLENKDKVRALRIKTEESSEGVYPTKQSIADSSYTPLSRPIFIYASKKAAEKPEVQAFVEFYIDNASRLAEAVGYVSLGHNPEEMNKIYGLVKSRFQRREVGTFFGKEENKKLSISSVLERGS